MGRCVKTLALEVTIEAQTHFSYVRPVVRIQKPWPFHNRVKVIVFNPLENFISNCNTYINK
jgi:hypothetical protein